MMIKMNSNEYKKILERISNDLRYNFREYDEEKLYKSFSEFQQQILSSRKKDNDIFQKLNSITGPKIQQILKKLGLNYDFIPQQKKKLVEFANGVILAEKKKEEFIILYNNSFKKKSTKKKSKKMEIDPSSYEEQRNNWLLRSDLNQLKVELKDINIKIIRVIVTPWKSNLNIQGRKKDDLILAILKYINKMRNFSNLGAY